METRFGLTFEILDRDYIARVRRERGYGVNPWTTHPRFLVSHRLLIDESYVGGLRDHLGHFRPGTLLILDEAHHAAPASGAKYAIDSKITRAVRDLAARFEHRLFLSATPHNGHSNSFSALARDPRPSTFLPRGAGRAQAARRGSGPPAKGGHPGDRRRVSQAHAGPGGHQTACPDDAPELRLSKLLDEYRQLREERLSGESKRTQAASALLICGLQQRLLSSIEAFATDAARPPSDGASPLGGRPRRTRTSRLTLRSERLDLLGGGLVHLMTTGRPSPRKRCAHRKRTIKSLQRAQRRWATPRLAERPQLFEREQQLLDEMDRDR